MRFTDFVCFEAIIPELQAADRDEAIKELVRSIDAAGKLGDSDANSIARAIIKRENEASTGMGKGVAVPHVKHKSVKDIVAVVGLSSSGIDFFALDKQPVHSIILVISPLDDTDKHLQVMENIFRHLQREKFRKFLRQCQETAQVKELLIEADDDPSL